MLAQTYYTIEWMIIKQIIDLLRYNDEDTVENWASVRLSRIDELNEFVLDVLTTNRSLAINSIENDLEEAYLLIQEHMRREFDVEVERDDEQVALAMFYLNRDVIRPLYGSENQMGTVEEAYRSIIEDVKGLDHTSELAEKIKEVIEEATEKGIKGGFTQKDGQTWSVRRIVSQIEKRLFTDTYSRAFERFRFRNVELVKVFKFVTPRQACYELQESGTICIKPRNEASEIALQYPNIHDEQHHYREPGGHRGFNCRHAWHNLNAEEDHTSDLYNPIDEMDLQYEIYKLKLKNAIRRYI